MKYAVEFFRRRTWEEFKRFSTRKAAIKHRDRLAQLGYVVQVQTVIAAPPNDDGEQLRLFDLDTDGGLR